MGNTPSYEKSGVTLTLNYPEACELFEKRDIEGLKIIFYADENLFDEIFENDNFELVKFLYTYGHFSRRIIHKIYKYNNRPIYLNFLEYLFEKGTDNPHLAEFYHEPIRKGNLKLIKFLHEHNCPWDNYFCPLAAFNGQLECLIYLHKNNCHWDKETCSSAAKNGHLNCLMYAHENNCSWDENTCKEAAMFGHLECLKYAHENGCKHDNTTCYHAANKGHYECLKYALMNNFEIDLSNKVYMKNAIIMSIIAKYQQQY